MSKFEVIIGNVGTVYSGNNYMQASAKYSAYVKASKAESGRASGESVVLMHCGHVRFEYDPPDPMDTQVNDPSNGGQSWTTRPYPDSPESYENQQTSVGTVRLVKLERP